MPQPHRSSLLKLQVKDPATDLDFGHLPVIFRVSPTLARISANQPSMTKKIRKRVVHKIFSGHIFGLIGQVVVSLFPEKIKNIERENRGPPRVHSIMIS